MFTLLKNLFKNAFKFAFTFSLALAVTAIVGTVGVFTYVYARSQDVLVKTVTGKTSAVGDQSANAIANAILGVVSKTWAYNFSIATDLGKDIGDIASAASSALGIKGVPNGKAVVPADPNIKSKLGNVLRDYDKAKKVSSPALKIHPTDVLDIEPGSSPNPTSSKPVVSAGRASSPRSTTS